MRARLAGGLLLLAACRLPGADAAPPAREDLPAASERLVALAETAHGEGRWDEAKTHADLAVRLDRGSVRAWAVRGRVRRTLRERGATHDYDSAMALAPEDTALLAERASARRMAGDPDGALVDLDAALEADAESGVLHARRGMVLGELGRFDEALAALDQALALDEQPDAMLLANRAMVHLSAGGLERARADLAAASDADPGMTYTALMLVGLGGDPARLEASTPQDAWTGTLREVMLGKRDPREAIAEAARAPHPVLARERLCEAWAYLAMRAEREGRSADAFVAYARALETDVPDFFETAIATARLDALSPDEGGVGEFVVGE